MNSEIKIEKIKPDNFDDFLNLVEKLAEYEKLAPPDVKAKERLKKDAFSGDPKYEAYLAKLNEKYVAYLIFFMNYSSFLALPVLYIEDIFVLEKYRKKGIGQLLFNFCVRKAEEKNCGRIEWHVLDWNKLGINFYEKNKAVHLSNWEYYRLDKNRFKEFL